MTNYFLAKIRYEKTAEDGSLVKVTEQYLVDAITFTEAEARINKEIEPFIAGDFSVQAITRANIQEIVPENWAISQTDSEVRKILNQNQNASSQTKWYKAKVNYISIDEVSGKEKRTPAFMLIEACSVNAAGDTLSMYMKGSMSDWEPEKIEETKILEVFKYNQ